MRNRDIIKQYVNTGNCISEYQFNKLTKSLLKTYLRHRLNVIKTGVDIIIMQEYEFEKYTYEQQNELLNFPYLLNAYILDNLDDHQKIIYNLAKLKWYVEYAEENNVELNIVFEPSFYNAMNKDQKYQFDVLIDTINNMNFDENEDIDFQPVRLSF